MGPLGRRHGFAADHVHRLRLVTADGRPHEIDADRAPELFWRCAVPARAASASSPSWSSRCSRSPACTGAGCSCPAPPPRSCCTCGAMGTDAARRSPRRCTGARWSTCVTPTSGAPPRPRRCSTRCARSPRHCTTTSASGPSPTSTLCTAIPGTRRPSTGAAWCCASCPPRPSTPCSPRRAPDVPSPLDLVELRAMGGALERPAAVRNVVAGRGAAWSVWVRGPLVPGGPGVSGVPRGSGDRDVPDEIRGAGRRDAGDWRAGALVPGRGAAELRGRGTARGTLVARRPSAAAVQQAVDPDGMFARTPLP